MRVLHTMIRVGDLDKSIAFYTDELTHNWDTKSYDIGNGFGHIAVSVPDAYKACGAVKAQGGKVTREAGPMKFGGSVIAFVEDPDGYKIEFIQKSAA